VRGEGAFLNNKPIKVNSKKKLSEAIITSAYSSDESQIMEGFRRIEKIALKCRRVILNFSPALDLCNIARGRMDGMFTRGTTPEDHAAGSLILTEAGGLVQNFDDNLWNVEKPGIIATNGYLQKEITQIVR
jgi:fructose-1,6-bisphosphatase/inositol monophosphatase family enzyme